MTDIQKEKSSSEQAVVCFDIGGTNIKYGLLNMDGEILDQGRFPTQIHDGKAILQDMENTVRTYMESTDSQPLSIIGISISTPGFVDTEKGVITDGTILDGFAGLEICRHFEEIFHLPTAAENDANSACIAEHVMGNGKGCRNMAVVTLGTGVGGGIIINDEIYTGSRNMAGEFGFMYTQGLGNQEPGEYVLSNYASTRALCEAASDALGRNVSGQEIFERAEQGDPLCKKTLDDFYRSLAMGIYNIAYVLNPQKILIGGAVSVQEDILPRVREQLDALTPSFAQSLNTYLEIDRCHFLNDAGLIGALCNFKTRKERGTL